MFKALQFILWISQGRRSALVSATTGITLVIAGLAALGLALQQVLTPVGTPDSLLADIDPFVIFIAALGCIAVGSYLRVSGLHALATAAVIALQNNLMFQFRFIPHAHALRFGLQRIFHFKQAEVPQLSALIPSFYTGFVRNALMIGLGLGFCIATHLMLTISVLGTMSVLMLLIWPMARYAKNTSAAAAQVNTAYAAKMQDYDTAWEMLRGMNLAQGAEADLRLGQTRVILAHKHATRARAFIAAMTIILLGGALGVLITFSPQIMQQFQLTSAQLATFLYFAILTGSGTAGFLERLSEARLIQNIAQTWADIHQLAVPPAQVTRHLPAKVQGILAFHHVSFTYPDAAAPALQRVTFSVAPGEKIAIVGLSGAGKSTLFHLIQRFYDPSQGAIYLDGISTRDVDPEALRNQLSIVTQDIPIFNTTLYDNVACAKPSATAIEVMRAIQDAQLDDLIGTLRQGVETVLTNQGAMLSAGERQRIALARAFLRQSRILLLDEATNALDAQTEDKIQQTVFRLSERATTLMIAHRLSTVLRCNRILVLHEGQLIAQGTHAELIQSCPLYQRMALLQFPDALSFTVRPTATEVA